LIDAASDGDFTARGYARVIAGGYRRVTQSVRCPRSLFGYRNWCFATPDVRAVKTEQAKDQASEIGLAPLRLRGLNLPTRT
jgi:hypothetical protein